MIGHMRSSIIEVVTEVVGAVISWSCSWILVPDHDPSTRRRCRAADGRAMYHGRYRNDVKRARIRPAAAQPHGPRACTIESACSGRAITSTLAGPPLYTERPRRIR